jgi:integrase
LLEAWRNRDLANRNLSPSARHRYDWAIKHLINELGTKRLEKLTTTQVETALERLGQNLAHDSVNKIRSTLKQALKFGVRRGYINRNVADVAVINKTKTKTTDHKRRALTAEEARVFTKACETERLGPMYIVMLNTGLRPGEATSLRWEDVDFAKRTIHVTRAVSRDGAHLVLTDQLKTKRSHRTIGLTETAVRALERQRERQTLEIGSAATWVDPALVFTTRTGTLLDPNNVRRDLARVSAAAGVGVLRPNELRHSAASLLYDAGVPKERISDLLGHESTRMLDAVYRHQISPSINTAVGVMDDILNGSPAETPPSTCE